MRKSTPVLAACMSLLIIGGALAGWLLIEGADPVHVNVAAAPNEAPPPRRGPARDFRVPPHRVFEPLDGYMRGFISGRVTDARDYPRLGVTVLGGAIHVDRYPSQRGRLQEFPFLREIAFDASTRTDRDGSYTLSFIFGVEEGVDAVPVYVRAGDERLVSRISVVQATPTTDIWDEDIVLLEPAGIAGRLVDTRGRAVEGVKISCVEQATNVVVSMRTSADGRFEFSHLRAEDYRLEPPVGHRFVRVEDYRLKPGQAQDVGTVVIDFGG